jgi:hypothetical protein
MLQYRFVYVCVFVCYVCVFVCRIMLQYLCVYVCVCLYLSVDEGEMACVREGGG